MGMILDIAWYFNIVPLFAYALAAGILGKATSDRVSFFSSIFIPIWLVNALEVVPGWIDYRHYLGWLLIWGVLGIVSARPFSKEHVSYFYKTNQRAVITILAINVFLLVFIRFMYPEMIPLWLYALIIFIYPQNIMSQEGVGNSKERMMLAVGPLVAGLIACIPFIVLNFESSIPKTIYQPLALTYFAISALAAASLMLSLVLRVYKRKFNVPITVMDSDY
jgi:hypothetical protein